ncbi:MAG TPA: anion permease [Candidatus Avoscillospira stercorigallinarum]|uniref:Anion permease n=1 Tax=Candidatus Avoscillospira stercorigallinarum TaxID=2840708 RepID=A0A9D0Z871_9FIRM|nr:anion permease [Candidatus Avoscillospira stercorigallinarum]
MLILLFTFIALLSGKLSYGVVGATIISLLIITGVLDVSEALAGFSNTNVAIMLCMMVLSGALMKTSLVERIVGLVRNVGHSERALIAGFGLIAAAMSQFMNAFVAVACLLPLITGLCSQLNIKRTKVIYPVMVIALTWIFLFPVGMGASTIAQMNGYLESFGSEFRFNMMDMTIGRLPGVILNTLFCIFILPRVCPDKPSVEFRDDLGREVAKSTLSRPREILCYIIAVVMVVLMILAGTIGIQVYTVAIVGASALALFGILSEKEAFQSINFGMVFFFAAILPLSTALTKTGASDVIADAIITILGGSTNPWLISTVFVLVCFVATQFLSNTGCVQVFTPLALMVCVQLNMNPVGIMSLVNIGCCASYLTPMANPGIPLTMSAGGYSLKDCIKIGILPGLLICAIGVVWCSLFFPAY